MLDTKTLAADLLRVNQEAEALCSGLSHEQLLWRPQANQWSIAENLVHLGVTTEVFLPAVNKAIAESSERNLVGGGTFQLNRYGRLLVWYVEPPPKIRLPAPKPLRPPPVQDGDASLLRFLELQLAMKKRMEDAEGLDLVGLRFPSPLASFVKMNLLEFFSVFNGHARRHLWQAAGVRRAMNF